MTPADQRDDFPHTQEHLPAPGPGVMVLRCGPPPMNDAMLKHLTALGYDADALFQF